MNSNTHNDPQSQFQVDEHLFTNSFQYAILRFKDHSTLQVQNKVAGAITDLQRLNGDKKVYKSHTLKGSLDSSQLMIQIPEGLAQRAQLVKELKFLLSQHKIHRQKRS